MERTEHDEAPAPESAQLRRRSARPPTARRRRILLAAALAGAIVLAGGGAAWAVFASQPKGPAETAKSTSKPSPAPSPKPTPEPAPEPTPEPTPEPEPVPQWDLDSPDSITVVVNKQRPLNPIDWQPGDLVLPAGIPNTNGQPMRAEAAAALEQMHAAASAEGFPFIITSAYRGYGLQASLFESYSARDGVAAAETYSARPGHSEHQTGLAADLDDGSGCAFMDCFGQTPTGLWLRENAHRFGFILRYDQGQQPVVGYIYEPWHFRYVGTGIAGDMRARGIVNLEEYFGLPAAPGY